MKVPENPKGSESILTVKYSRNPRNESLYKGLNLLLIHQGLFSNLTGHSK